MFVFDLHSLSVGRREEKKQAFKAARDKRSLESGQSWQDLKDFGFFELARRRFFLSAWGERAKARGLFVWKMIEEGGGGVFANRLFLNLLELLPE